MSKRICITIFVGVALSVAAVIMLPFKDWNVLQKGSPDIFVARCKETPNPYRVPKGEAVNELTGRMVASEMEVIMVLKGSTSPGPARLTSRYWPRQGEHYLIFSYFHDGFFQSVEEYRVVPLGLGFSTNLVAGKTLNEQIQSLLRSRLSQLNQQLGQLQEEKKRLEEGLNQ